MKAFDDATSHGELSVWEGVWRARDGKTLTRKGWYQARSPARAAVVLVHGLNGSVDDFTPLIDALAPAGYRFHAFGLRGQGGDPDARRRGDLRDWRRLRDDVVDFAQLVGTEAAGRPVFVFGESMGALCALQAAGDGAFAGLILSSPVVRFREETTLTWWQEGLVRALFRVAPWYRLDLRSLGRRPGGDPVVTRDKAYLNTIQNAPYRIRAFSLGFYRELIRLVLATSEAAATVALPTLVLAAGQDVFVTADAVTAFFKTLAAEDKTLRVYPESYHLLVRDHDAARVIGEVRAWLDARTTPIETLS